MCLWNPGTEMMSRWRFDMPDASGGDSTENQHEEDRMRDIHIGKRGSEAAGEEQPDKFRKTVRFVNKQLRVHQRLQIQLSLWSILQLVRHKIGWGPYLCRKVRSC